MIGTALGTAVAGALLGPVLGALAAEIGTEPVFGCGARRSRLALAYVAYPDPGGAAPERQGLREVAATMLSRPVLDRDGLRRRALGDVRRDRGAGAAADRRPRRRPRADRRRLHRRRRAGGRRSRRSPAATRTGSGGALPFVVGLSDLRGGDGRDRRRLQALGGVLAALIVTSLGAGICFAPALTLLSERPSPARLHQGFAAGLSNMAWASGQVLGGARRRRRSRASPATPPRASRSPPCCSSPVAYARRGPAPPLTAPAAAS